MAHGTFPPGEDGPLPRQRHLRHRHYYNHTRRLKGYDGEPDILPLEIDGAPVLTGQNGVAYAGFTATASGGTEPYTYSLVGTWPAGLSINAGTGEVSGTPTEDGSFADLSVRVTDDAAETADLPTFTIVIDPA